eukprot:SAG31_NODE_1664_length_7585_cov_10.994523_8_plen_285_part_00
MFCTGQVSWNQPPFWRMTWPGPCTSNGGHAYSVDGREWHISPVPPYTAETEFEDGTKVFWRARERPHVVFNEHGEPAFLLNGVGDPIKVNCSAGPSTPGRVPTDPNACQCPSSGFHPCPPQTGGGNTGGPGGDHTFTLLQPIATAASMQTAPTRTITVKTDDAVSVLYGVSVLLCVLPTVLITGADAHGAVTFPKPRNAIDGSIPPWSNWSWRPGQAATNPPVGAFSQSGTNTQGSCAVPAKTGVSGAVDSANGQACYWFSNGCTIGCPSCDGSTNHPGHGAQK